MTGSPAVTSSGAALTSSMKRPTAPEKSAGLPFSGSGSTSRTSGWLMTSRGWRTVPPKKNPRRVARSLSVVSDTVAGPTVTEPARSGVRAPSNSTIW